MYAKSFDLNSNSLPNPKARIYLDLGEVRDVAEVRLNGKGWGYFGPSHSRLK